MLATARGTRHELRAVDLGIRFTLWALSTSTPIDYTTVMREFDVSRATAYRLLARWRDLAGVSVVATEGANGVFRTALVCDPAAVAVIGL